MDQDQVLSVHAAQELATGFAAAPSFDALLPPGAILVLFGPSGAGKTTMLRQIAGLERPQRGTIRFGGSVWFDAAANVWVPPQQRGTSLVFQQAALFPHLSVRANIGYAAASSPRVDELAALLDITQLLDRQPRALSGGESQRVSLARALAPRPRLALLDEPFASLDVPARIRLRRDLRALLHRTGTPAVLVTHDRAEAMSMGDSIAVVLDGRVRQIGPVAEVFSRPVDADVAAALGVEAVLPARVVDESGGVLTVAVGASRIYVAEREQIPIGTEVFACIRAEDVSLELQSPAHASARNHLPARVVAVAPEGPIDRVAIDCGFPLDALITRQARQELALAPGAAVTAAIKATSVHLVPRE
jgi:molybdenum ABC transporter ATP-binding protein